MALDFRVTDARANAALDALFGTAANTGILRIYAGSLSAGAPAAPAGALLAELTMNGSAFGASAAQSGQSYNRIVAGAVASDASANAAGTAGCFVLFDSAGTTALAAGTVGTSGCDATIDNTTVAAGAAVSCSAAEIRLPKGWATA